MSLLVVMSFHGLQEPEKLLSKVLKMLGKLVRNAVTSHPTLNKDLDFGNSFIA